MSEINLSSAVRNSLVSLQATAELLTTTQERLATGNRVNSALDDPTAFFTASALNNRAADLSTLLDAEQQAIRTVEVADSAISAIEDLVSSARAQANAALQTEDLGARAIAAQAFDDILAQIELLADDASFNGTNLLEGDDLLVVFNEDGSSSLTVEGFDFTNASGLGLERQSQTASATPSTGTINFADLAGDETLTIDVDGAGATAAVDIDLSLIATGGTPAVSAEDTIAISSLSIGNTVSFDNGDGSPVEVTLTDPATNGGISLEDQLVAVTGDDFTVTSDGTNLTITNTAADFSVTQATAQVDAAAQTTGFNLPALTSGDTISVIGVDDTGTPISPGIDVLFDDGTLGIDIATISDIDQLAAAVQGELDAAGATNITVVQDPDNPGQLAFASSQGDISASFNDADGAGISSLVNTSLSGTAFQAAGPPTTIADSAATGTPFEAGVVGTLDVADVVAAIDTAFGGTSGLTVAEAGGNISLSSTAGDFAVSGATTVAGTGFVAGNGTDFATDTDINNTLTAIDDALATLRSSAGSLGADLSTIQFRQDFTAALINTLEGGAGDLTLADLNEEGANLLTLQTRQQLASTSLSFATQADQSVLSLFG